MRHSWKQHVAAAAVAVVVMTAYSVLLLVHSFGRERASYLAAKAHYYDQHSNGQRSVLMVFSTTIVSAWTIAIAIIPYELTLKALNSKRLRGED